MLDKSFLFLPRSATIFALFVFGVCSIAVAGEQISDEKSLRFRTENVLFLGQNETQQNPTFGDKVKRFFSRIIPSNDTENGHTHSTPQQPITPPIQTQPPKPITASEVRQSQSYGMSSQERASINSPSPSLQQQGADVTSIYHDEGVYESGEENVYEVLAQIRKPIFDNAVQRQPLNVQESLSYSPNHTGFQNVTVSPNTPIVRDSQHRIAPLSETEQPHSATHVLPSTSPQQTLTSSVPIPADSQEAAIHESMSSELMNLRSVQRSDLTMQAEPFSVSTAPQESVARLNTIGTMMNSQSGTPLSVVADQTQEQEKQRLVSANPVLEVETILPKNASINQEVTCEVRVKNSGDAHAEQVAVNVVIPAWINVQDIQASDGDYMPISREDGSGTIDLKWTINRIKQGETKILVLRVVSQLPRAIELLVSYSFQRPAILAKVEVQEPKLEMVLLGADEAVWNKSAVYKLIVRNIGNGKAENINLELLQTNKSELKTYHEDVIMPGEYIDANIEVTAGRAQEYIDIIVSATGAHDLKGEVKRRIKVLRPKLEMSVQTLPKHLVDTPAEISVLVRNTGTADEENASIEAVLPLGIQYVSSNEGGIFSPHQNAIQWRGKTIPKGEMMTFTLICLPKREGNHRVSLEVSENGGHTVIADSVTFTSEAVTELELVVLKPQGPIELGKDAEYTIQLNNIGTKAAENIQVFMAFGWKMGGLNEPIDVLRPKATGGEIAAQYDSEKGLVEFEKIPLILPKQSITMKVVTEAVETGTVQVKTDVTGADVYLTNGLSVYVFSRQGEAATASENSKQDEVIR